MYCFLNQDAAENKNVQKKSKCGRREGKINSIEIKKSFILVLKIRQMIKSLHGK